MTNKEFVMWLGGYLDAVKEDGVSPNGVQVILRKMEEIRNVSEIIPLTPPSEYRPEKREFPGHPPEIYC